MKHAILILWHKDVQQLRELIRFFDEEFSFYIHVDKKNAAATKAVKELQKEREGIHVYCKYKVNWGGLNIVKAELFLLEEILKAGMDFDYIHFFSGQDYPIKDLPHIKRFFEMHRGTEFIEYMRLPSESWDKGTYARFDYFRFYDLWDFRTPQGFGRIMKLMEYQKKAGFKRRKPDQFDILYGGSNWMSITNECAEYVIGHRKQNKAFYNRLKYTFAPDEVYFHSVILNSPFALKVKNDNLRYILWVNNGTVPQVLTERNWTSIVTSDCLFARKFDSEYSAGLKECLHKYIMNKETVAVGPQGCWQNKDFSGHCYDKGLAEGLLHLLPLMQVQTIGDFGCGPGWYTALFRDNGYDAEGYDGNPHVEEMSALFFADGFYCQQADFTDEVEAELPFDLVFSIEVGEHIPSRHENTFLDNLARNSRKYIILSWAVEGQPGNVHVNCRPNSYIIARMKERGFGLNTPAGNYLRKCATHRWLKDTIMVFEKI